MNLGIDVDGVLANFNQAYMDAIVRVSADDRFGPNPIIRMWDYPEEQFGYPPELIPAVWATIEKSEHFWRRLLPLPACKEDLKVLNARRRAGDYVYFITARPGVKAKQQTETWLNQQGFNFPTVLISSQKGLLAAGLALDLIVDDKPSNLSEVRDSAPSCATYLIDRTYNQNTLRGYQRADSVTEALQKHGIICL